ncbi:MAG TPA: tRNA (N(6)-L-threonylcarbamoyladenosine(37)-C(2))-methylthiotransferase MtaB [Sedimentisphaerales bacterium]|nr:tRNA (N(6)-L-threonylcarbamoyladenosine(37)-C(2))-methylthiotransferase MtaB [Sedimentisphaerales bacterium]
MKTFSIKTLGCKVNQYESQQIRELLEQLGLNAVGTAKEKPDLVVINTCCVTHTASAKSRQNIRKAQKLSAGAIIVVCGCLPSLRIGELHNPNENVYLIGGHESLAPMLSLIATGLNAVSGSHSFHSDPHKLIKPKIAEKIKQKNISAEQSTLPPLTSFRGHTRAFLKVQDGCDGYCSYCIIPRSRPFLASKPAEAALCEAQALVKAGHKEIVITGICLGAYGQKSVRRRIWDRPENDSLAELLEKIARVPGLRRIRLSSLGPKDVTSRLLDVFCENRNLMPHLHLSLQSGSNRVLKKMCRQYTADEFRRTVEAIRNRLDRPAITTDIIVGFPGETEADFEQTLELARDVGFAKMHVFSFSPRKGTAAAAMQGVVDKRVTKERSRVLRQLDKELGWKFREQFVGETAVVLVESDNGKISGRSERYFTVYLEGAARSSRENDLVTVRLTRNSMNGMAGHTSTQEPYSLACQTPALPTDL